MARLMQGDIVLDPAGKSSVVVYVSQSGRVVIVEYPNERFAVLLAETLTLHLSGFSPASLKAQRQIKGGV